VVVGHDFDLARLSWLLGRRIGLLDVLGTWIDSMKACVRAYPEKGRVLRWHLRLETECMRAKPQDTDDADHSWDTLIDGRTPLPGI